MSEEIKVSEEAFRTANAIFNRVDSVTYYDRLNKDSEREERDWMAKQIQLLLNQRDTKIAALEAALHNSCEAHGMRVRSLLQIIEERTSALERLEIEVVELRKNKEGLDWLNYFYKHPNPSHTGDCSYYSSIMNGNPFDGICTCGYGWRFYTANNNDDVHLVSRERKEALALNSTKGEK